MLFLLLKTPKGATDFSCTETIEGSEGGVAKNEKKKSRFQIPRS